MGTLGDERCAIEAFATNVDPEPACVGPRVSLTTVHVNRGGTDVRSPNEVHWSFGLAGPPFLVVINSHL